MEDSVITIVAIFLAVILMFIFPLMAVSDRLDDISQLSVQSETSEFVDRIRKKGVLTNEEYNSYIQTASSGGITPLDIEIQIQILDENPNIESNNENKTKIGENLYYNIYTSQIEEKEDSRFNSEFFKYYENGKDVLKVTPHDIVSIANFAKENNLKYSLNEPKENSYYVTIDVLTKNEKIYNFEKKSQDEYTSFIEQNKIFKCSEIRVNKITKRVEHVKYEEI